MLRADKCADLWYCCLVQDASCARGIQRVKLPGQQSADKRIQLFPGQTSQKMTFPEICYYILQNWLLWMFIPLVRAGGPGHLLRSLPVHKDECFELTQYLLPCSEFFWSSFPVEVSCSVVNTGSPGQVILALRASLMHSLTVFCVEGNLGWGLTVSTCAHLRAT